MKRNHKANGDALPHLLDPLLDRVRAGKPGVGLAFYDGEHLDSGWPKGAGDYARERGYYLEHLKLADLGEAPAASLVRRQRVGDHLFSVEIDPGDLRDSALQRGGAVALLNIHRDTFRDEGICLLLWVPRSRARRFMDLASNLADYRTVDLDIPGQPGDGSGSGAPVPERGAPKTKHNLPIASLGAAFAGREAEMRRLREMLDQSGSGAIADSLALEGLGGVGKTRLALEYAWAHLGDYDSVFLIRADDPSSGRAGIAALAGPEWLDLPGGAERPEPERLAAALDWFRAHRRWLLIIDNADSEESTEWLRDDILPALRGVTSSSPPATSAGAAPSASSSSNPSPRTPPPPGCWRRPPPGASPAPPTCAMPRRSPGRSAPRPRPRADRRLAQPPRRHPRRCPRPPADGEGGRSIGSTRRPSATRAPSPPSGRRPPPTSPLTKPPSSASSPSFPPSPSPTSSSLASGSPAMKNRATSEPSSSASRTAASSPPATTAPPSFTASGSS
ncbi:MAG: ATP-binding protein [Verrucomicrobiales bacterium]